MDGLAIRGNSSSITNNGSLHGGGADSHTIFIIGNSNTITNNGSILVSGADSGVGITVHGVSNTFVNNGTITVIPFRGTPEIIIGGNSNSGINRGTIEVRGRDTDINDIALILGGSNVTFTNSGTILGGIANSSKAHPFGTPAISFGTAATDSGTFINAAGGIISTPIGATAFVSTAGSIRFENYGLVQGNIVMLGTASTLLIGTGGSVLGDIQSNGLITVDRSDLFNYDGVISGAGAFNQINGTSIFNGIRTYTGTTTVDGGTLIVNGSIASSSGVTVNNGATLGGNGTVASTTVNAGGTLSPGASIGTLNVNGNLTFNPGATYLVEVSPTAADRTNVTGTANLAGTVYAVFQPG